MADQAAAQSNSGIDFVRFAVSGRNRFVSGIALLAALGGFLFGYDTGIISQALPFIQQQWKPSTETASWIVASLLVGAVVGAAASGYLSERLGRRWTMFVAGGVYVVGALLSAFANGAPWLIGARFVLGLAVGTASFVAPEYISEQTPRRIRGGTVTFNQIMVTLGILLAYIAGYLLKGVIHNWRWMLGIAVAPGVGLAVAMLFVPSSPRWLVGKGRDEEAVDVLRRTREDEGEVEEELEEIRDVVGKERHRSIGDLFRVDLRPLMLVGIGLAVFQQFVGINTVIYFASTILKYTGATTDHAVLLAVYVGVTNFVTTLVAALILDWVGRRVLLLAGTAIATIALGALGAYFWFPALYHDHSWAGIACVIVYIIGFAIGLGPVFWLMISEIYPLHLRSKAMAVATMFNWGANFIVSYWFLQMTDAIGRAQTFWVYAGMGVLAILFFLWKVPETKQRSLEQIEREIGGAGTAEAMT